MGVPLLRASHNLSDRRRERHDRDVVVASSRITPIVAPQNKTRIVGLSSSERPVLAPIMPDAPCCQGREIVRVGVLAQEHPKSQAQQSHSTGAVAYGCVARINDFLHGEIAPALAARGHSDRASPPGATK